jgi:hypothetical protein
MNPQPDSSIYSGVKRYADAWVANDLRAIVDSYHDEVVFHYFGRSPLAGTHRGKAACLAGRDRAHAQIPRARWQASRVLDLRRRPTACR